MNKKLTNIFYCLLVVIPAIIVFISFFKALHLALGDAPFYYSQGLKELVSFPVIWSQRGVDFGGRNLALWLSPLMIAYGSLNKFFGLNNDLITRIIFYFPSVVLAGLGPFFLARYLKLSKTTQFFSSLFYLLNTYFLLLLDGGQVGIALAYGIFPFGVLLWRKFIDNKSVNKFASAFVATSVLCYVDPRVTVLLFISLMLWQILGFLIKRDIGSLFDLFWFVLAGILLVPINAFWLLPLTKSGLGGLSTSVANLQLSSLLNSLFLFAPNWPSNFYGKVVPPFFYFALVPVLIFGSSISKKTDKKYYVFASMFIFFAFLAKGTTPPLGNFYEYFVNRIPFGSVFRDSSKFFIPMFLLGGILIGNTIDVLSGVFKNKYFKSGVLGLAYVYLLLLIYPAIFGKLNFNLSSRDGGSDYQLIYDQLNNEEPGFKTLWFNEKPQIAFETNEKPALSANQLVTYRPFASMTEGEDAYNFLNNPNFPDWLRVLGVRHLILSGDSRNISPTETDVKNWAEENNLISKAKGLTKNSWGTNMPVYGIENPRPEVYSVKKIAVVVGADLPISDSMPAAVYIEDGKFDPKVLENVKQDSVSIVLNGGSKTDLAMSFLQKYFKSPMDSDKSEWSEFDSAKYLKVKYELLIRGFVLRDFDYGRGVAFSTKKDELIKYVFNIPQDGDYIVATRSATEKNQKLTWSTEKRALKAGVYQVDIKNSAGLQVLNVVAVIPESEYNNSVKLAEKYISRFGKNNDLGKSIAEWHTVTKLKTSQLSSEYKLPGGDNWLIYTQNFDTDWQSENANSIHLPVFSMVNGFYTESGNIKINFAGQKILETGARVSLGSVLILLVSYLVYAIIRRLK